MAQQEITAEDIGLPVDPAVDAEKLRRAIATASDRPIAPSKFNLGETRSPRQILEDEMAAKQNLPLQMVNASDVQIQPKGVSVASVMKDPNFRALPEPERRKVMETVLAQDSGFQGLPKEEQAKVRAKLMPAPGFFGEMGQALSTFDIRNNMFNRGAEIANENIGYQTEIQNSPEWRAETARMRQEHPDYGPMQSYAHMQEWLSGKVMEKFKAARSEQPKEESPGIVEMSKQLVNAAYEHPGLVVGEVLKGVGEDPEILMPLNWELGLAKAVTNVGRALKVAEGVTRAAAGAARTAEVGAAMGAIQVPISATEELAKTGEISPEQVGKEATVAALTGAVLHAAVKLAGGATKVKTGKVVTPDAEVQAVGAIERKVEAGQPVGDAAKAVFDAMGVPEEDAAAIAAKLEETTHAPEAREVPQGGEQQHLGTGPQRAEAEASGGNRPVRSAEVPQEEVEVAPPINLSTIRNEIGWAEIGGKAIRDPTTGDVVDRSKWVPRSDFWRDRPANVTEKDANSALDKVERGDPLTNKERQFIKYAKDTLVERYNKSFEKFKESVDERVAIQGEGKVIRPQQFQPLPEGVPRRFATPEEARAIYEMAGVDPEAAAGMAGNVPIAMGALRQRLTKFMGGQKYADSTLLDAVREGKLRGEAGQIDPWLVKYLAAVGIGGASAYALTGEKDKGIAAAVAIGALPIAVKVASKVGNSVRGLFDRFLADRTFHADEPFRAYLAQNGIVHHALENWGRATDALLTGVPDKEASRIKVRDWIQGHRDMTLTPQEQAYATEIQRLLNTVGQSAGDAGVIKHIRENYLTGLYQKAPFQTWTDIFRALSTDEAFRGNYTGMGRSSRFNLQKTIPDYRMAEQLFKEGKFPLIPLTNDPVAIAMHYAQSVQKTMAVRKLINDLKATPTNRMSESGRPIPAVVGDTPFETAQRITAVNHKVGEKMGFPPERIEAQTRSQILNAPSDYVYVAHPSLEGLRVHADIAPALKMLFDTSDPGRMSRALYAASMGLKGLFFTVSLFHPWALAAVAGAIALPRAKFMMSLPKYWKEIGGARQMLKSSEGASEIARASRDGLGLFRSMTDVDPSFVQRTLNSMEFLAGKAGSPIALPFKAAGEVHKWFHNFLWNEVHPTLKLAAYNAELKNWMLKNPTGDATKAGRQIASGVNDLFGGQNWFELANTIPGDLSRKIAMSLFSPAGRRLQQTLFLSPDWNISAARAWYGALKSVMPGIDRKASDSMYRGYLVWSALTYLGAANFMSNMYTGQNIWDQKDWTYVQTGDGRKVQLNKHFMEMVHLWHNPVQFVTNKLNLVPREVLDQVMGKEWIAYDTTKQEFYGPPMDSSLIGRAMHAGKTVIPISIANIIRDPAAGAVSWLTGFPVYGSTFEDRAKQSEDTAAKKAAAKGKSEDTARMAARKRNEKAARKREESASP